MPVVVATVTNQARQYWPQFLGGMLGISSGPTTGVNWNPLFKKFRIGRGGWINPGPVPRVPDPTLTDLDIIVNPSRYSSLLGNVLFFEKSLTSGDYTFSAPSTLVISCLLDFADFNDINAPPLGTNPSLWELGVYSDMPGAPGQSLMVLYGTFTGEIKTGAIQIENDFRLTF